MIYANKLTRNYGSVVAVKDVSFKIEEGEIVGLLGHNGAGKTTIMKILTGFLEPTAGTASINGFDIEEERGQAQALIGYLPENSPVYPDMSVAAYLDFAAELKGVEAKVRPARLRRAISATGLSEKAHDSISTLSRGFRQRVGVAQAILNDPKIVILDEPTNGLDPGQIQHMRALIRELAKSATVILSTHILQEVQAVCDRAIIIDRGRVALDSKLSALGTGARLRLVTSANPKEIKSALNGTSLDVDSGAGRDDSTEPPYGYFIALNGEPPNKVATSVARQVLEAGHELHALHPEKHDLENVFAEIAARGHSELTAADRQQDLSNEEDQRV